MKRYLPTGERARDLGFLVGLSVLAMVGFAPTFTGFQFAVVGILGLLLGAVVAQVAHVRRWPAVAPILLGVALFVLLGGPLCLRATGATAYLPLPGTLATLVDQLLFGWKELLTTLPPVDGAGVSLVIPWVLGLTTGVGGTLLLGAHRWRRLPQQFGVMLPLVAPLGLLAAVILLGVRHPASVILQGVLFGAGALAWLALRSMALTTRTSTAVGRTRRALGGLALLAVASLLAWPVGGWLAGSDDQRVVLRTYVEPPFEIGEYPSPLAAFRRYVKLPPEEADNPVNLHDDQLLRVEGVTSGTRVRFATLDAYDGIVWRASEDTDPTTSLDTYQRVSNTIDNPVDGEEVDVEITLEEGYSGVWLPTVGALRSISFEEGDTLETVDSFRYNLAASAAIVPTGLEPGDRYRFTAVLPDDSLKVDTPPSGAITPAAQAAAFLETQATDWTEGETDLMRRVFKAAAHLKEHGRFSDGVLPEEKIYHAGHHQKRLGDEFVNAPIMAGNAEQYAALMALLANRIGVPARVVMGAVVPESGVVSGADVTAWVELQASDGSWRTMPTDLFMSNKKPADQPPQQEEEMSGSVVPPPAPIPPPSSEGEQTDTQLKTRSDVDDESTAFDLPLWLKIVLVVVGGPLVLLLLFLAAILGAKALRRRRRRTHGRPSARIGGGWRELVDLARDLGHHVPVRAGLTRREQAQQLGTVGSHQLAGSADAHVFGPHGPAEADVGAYWQQVDAERRAMSAAARPRQRLKAALSLRTFRQRWAREPQRVEPGTLAGLPATGGGDDPGRDGRNKGEPELVGPR